MKYFKGIGKKKLVLYFAGIIVVVLITDFFIGKRQQAIIDERETKIKRLERQAFYMLSAEIRDIKETDNIKKTGRYEALLRIDNVANEPVYISHPHIKAYIQTGEISWSEVPVQDTEPHKTRQVYKIEPESYIFYKKWITVNRSIPYNKNLLPEYMHVRFHISMYVLPESGFKGDDVVERKSTTYVYLKPYFVSDKEIRKAIDFGDTKVPVYIPITAFRIWK